MQQHTFWSWSLTLISKLRKVIGSMIRESDAPRPNGVIIERVHVFEIYIIYGGSFET